jgi:hypothetical protein
VKPIPPVAAIYRGLAQFDEKSGNIGEFSRPVGRCLDAIEDRMQTPAA